MKKWLAIMALLGSVTLCPGAMGRPLVGDIATYPDWEPELEDALETVELELAESHAQAGPSEEANLELYLDEIDENTGTSGSVHSQIPEPMVFDLVRPLGARKGELETNTLFLKPLRRRTSLEWAPEIEYAFLDNHAIEFELPFDNWQPEDLKLAYQATLGTKLDHRYIHGVQVMGRYHLHEKAVSVDKLYIGGYEFNKRWSTLVIGGLRATCGHRKVSLTGLLNPSIFYACSESIRLGMETNLELTRPKRNHYLFMPQLHWEAGKHYSIQVGCGIERYSTRRFRPVIGLRLIRVL
jgi:hypothetical protein